MRIMDDYESNKRSNGDSGFCCHGHSSLQVVILMHFYEKMRLNSRRRSPWLEPIFHHETIRSYPMSNLITFNYEEMKENIIMKEHPCRL